MINVQKVKKGLGKCWKFFAAKPAYAGLGVWQCAYCGMQTRMNSAPGQGFGGKCSGTGGYHVWQRIG